MANGCVNMMSSCGQESVDVDNKVPLDLAVQKLDTHLLSGRHKQDLLSSVSGLFPHPAGRVAFPLLACFPSRRYGIQDLLHLLTRLLWGVIF